MGAPGQGRVLAQSSRRAPRNISTEVHEFVYHRGRIQFDDFRFDAPEFVNVPLAFLSDQLQGFFAGLGENGYLGLKIIIPVDVRFVEHRPARKKLAVAPDEYLHV
jgi:hypothetical protein